MRARISTAFYVRNREGRAYMQRKGLLPMNNLSLVVWRERERERERSAAPRKHYRECIRVRESAHAMQLSVKETRTQPARVIRPRGDTRSENPKFGMICCVVKIILGWYKIFPTVRNAEWP